VKANELQSIALWHKDFLGWAFVSSAPTRKDHITDWITAKTSKGLKLQSYSIEPLAIRVTGDIALNHYRIKLPGPGRCKDSVHRGESLIFGVGNPLGLWSSSPRG